MFPSFFRRVRVRHGSTQFDQVRIPSSSEVSRAAEAADNWRGAPVQPPQAVPQDLSLKPAEEL